MFVEMHDASYSGVTESGIEIHRRDFVVNKTWSNLARVLSAHPSCRDVKVNDLVCFRKHSTKRLGAVEGELLVLLERHVLGIVRKENGDVWFQ